ncbi:MAG: sipW 2 [Thermoleophilia bacterium]|nr:sipW 2 [Thermoleophilia bacterium]
MTALHTLRCRLANLVLLLALLVLVVFAIGPHTGKYRTLSILSGSMEPTFATGDAVIVTPIPTSDLRAGDVISYHAPVDGSPLVTHRVVEVLERGTNPIVRTRGDANAADDPWTAQLEGGTVWKQRMSIPYAGHATRALRHPAMKTITVYGLPLLLLCIALGGVWGRRELPEDGLDATRYLADDELDADRLDVDFEFYGPHEEIPLPRMSAYLFVDADGCREPVA